MKLRYFLILILFIGAAGCSKTSNPVTTMPVVTGPIPADFGLKINGADVERKKDSTNSLGYGQLFDDPTYHKILNFYFASRQVFGGSRHDLGLSITIYGVSAGPAIYQISHSITGQPYADEGHSVDSLHYAITNAAGDGGTLEITKYDTVLNLVSGKFSFVSTLSWPLTGNFPKRDTVTSGFFTDVPIAEGSYGQGSFSAIIDGFAYDTKSSSLYTISPYIIEGEQELHIKVYSPRTSDIRDVDIQLQDPPRVGEFPFAQNATDTTARLFYSSTINKKYYSIFSDRNSVGKVSIIKCDTALRRISGTFNFSGTSGGNSTTITKGVIDNLQWYRE